MRVHPVSSERALAMAVGKVALDGDLRLPAGARGLVVFAHGSGSSRRSPRNRFVAQRLQARGLGTLLFDLLTPGEEERDRIEARMRFDIPLLADRLDKVAAWVRSYQATKGLPLGLFGASTGAAAALVAAADLHGTVRAIVSRGGRPDLAGGALGQVRVPTLFIVGGSDADVLALNREALARIPALKRLAIVPGAGHLFEEPGALDEVAALAGSWFLEHLAFSARPRQPRTLGS